MAGGAAAPFATGGPRPGPRTLSHDHIREIFAACQNLVNASLRPLLRSGVALFGGVLLVLQWHLRCRCPFQWLAVRFPRSDIWRVMGVNLLVFQIYYGEDLRRLVGAWPLIISLSLILFEVLLDHCLDDRPEGSADFADHIAPCEESDDSDLEGYTRETELRPALESAITRNNLWDRSVVVTKAEESTDMNVYMNLAGDFGRCLGLFACQLCLTFMYVLYLNGDAHSHDASKVNYSFWCVAVGFQIYAGEDQMGLPYNTKFWEQVFQEDEELASSWRWVGGWLPMRCSSEWRLRRGMDLIINSICRSVVVLTVPILLACKTSELDFIKDCLAISAITTLDDETAVSLEEAFKKLRVAAGLPPLRPTSLGHGCSSFLKDEADAPLIQEAAAAAAAAAARAGPAAAAAPRRHEWLRLEGQAKSLGLRERLASLEVAAFGVSRQDAAVGGLKDRLGALEAALQLRGGGPAVVRGIWPRLVVLEGLLHGGGAPPRRSI